MKKNILAFFIGILICVFLFIPIEIFFRLNQKYSWLKYKDAIYHFKIVENDITESLKIHNNLKNAPIFSWQPDPVLKNKKHLTHDLLDESQRIDTPCCIVNMNLNNPREFDDKLYTKEGELVYSAHFTIDSKGRRFTPINKNAKYNIIMMGDSYTLGEGVNDNESAPYFLALKRINAQVYNLGLAGAGPNDILYELTQVPHLRILDIPKRPTLIFYSFTDNHLERMLCRSLCLRPENHWMINKPHYSIENGKLVFKGIYQKDRFFLNFIYSIMAKSMFLKFFNIVIPTHFTEEHFETFSLIIESMKDTSKILFPDSEFYLVFYPDNSKFFSVELKEFSTKKGIKILDYSMIDLNTATNNRAKIPVDAHPSPISQFVFSYLLDRDLPNLEE